MPAVPRTAERRQCAAGVTSSAFSPFGRGVSPPMAGRSTQGGGVDPDALMKKADKLSVVSLTQWKPDYEQAAGLFEQAGAPPPTQPERRLCRQAGGRSEGAPTAWLSVCLCAAAQSSRVCPFPCDAQPWPTRTAAARATPPPRSRSCPTARRSWESAWVAVAAWLRIGRPGRRRNLLTRVTPPLRSSSQAVAGGQAPGVVRWVRQGRGHGDSRRAGGPVPAGECALH